MLYALCLMPDTSCLMPHASCLTPCTLHVLLPPQDLTHIPTRNPTLTQLSPPQEFVTSPQKNVSFAPQPDTTDPNLGEPLGPQ